MPHTQSLHAAAMPLQLRSIQCPGLQATWVQVGRDPRPVMRAAYECFRTGAQPDAILQASGPSGLQSQSRAEACGSMDGNACKGRAEACGSLGMEARVQHHPPPLWPPAAQFPSVPAVQAAGGDQQGHDRFYALLYVGLWHEAHGDAAAAEAAITQVGFEMRCPLPP